MQLSFVDRIRLKISAQLMRVLLKYLPKEPSILGRLGTIELAFENPLEAERLLWASLEIDRKQPELWFRRGLALEALGREPDALQCYGHATALRADYAEAIEAMRKLVSRAGKKEPVPARAKTSKTLKSKDPVELVEAGKALASENRIAEALQHYDRAIAIKPEFTPAHGSRGLALMQLEQYDEALAAFDRVLAIQPNHLEALRMRGVTVAALWRIDEAIWSVDQVLRLQPNDLKARYARGFFLMQANRLEEAIAEFDLVIAGEPGNANAQWLKASCLLLSADFERGLPLFEWRWKKEGIDRDQYCGVGVPDWNREMPLAGRTLYIAHEQGMGDFIQFARYVPMLERLGAKVLLAAPNALVSLAARVSPSVTIVRHGERIPARDYVCATLSLPLAFRTTVATIPAEVPYLSVEASLQGQWKERLGPRTSLRVGIAWSGNPVHQNDRNRSIALKTMAPLFDLPLEFHVLQKDLRAEEVADLASRANVHRHEAELNEFADTAALIGELDLVISVDTAIAHLAGALAKPVWILLPFNPDWRWMLGRTDSPWYPTARLFRQQKPGDWQSVVDIVAAELRGMAG